jgi:hypothetical protein
LYVAKKKGAKMVRLVRFTALIPALILIIGIPFAGSGNNDLPVNIRFDPEPKPGDTTVSGTCSPLQSCVGYIRVVKRMGEDVVELGSGGCGEEEDIFTVDLCKNPGKTAMGESEPADCVPYKLKASDVIAAIQYVEGSEGELRLPIQPPDVCDSSHWFTVGKGTRAIPVWSMIALILALILLSIALIWRKRARPKKL